MVAHYNKNKQQQTNLNPSINYRRSYPCPNLFPFFTEDAPLYTVSLCVPTQPPSPLHGYHTLVHSEGLHHLWSGRDPHPTHPTPPCGSWYTNTRIDLLPAQLSLCLARDPVNSCLIDLYTQVSNGRPVTVELPPPPHPHPPVYKRTHH